MATLLEDIKKQAEWTVEAFKVDGYKLDFSINSLIEIDRFFEMNMIDEKPKKRGRLAKNLGPVLFSIASYLTETILRNSPGSELLTDDDDPYGEVNFSIKLPDNGVIFPWERVMKRFKNGFEDSIYPYGYELTKTFVEVSFDQSFWEMRREIEKARSKPWWRL